MTGSNDYIAIIGGGLAGLSMALNLHKLGIKCTIYESNEGVAGSRTQGGGMMVAANALQLLDEWGVYARMVPKGYQFKYAYYKNDKEETVDRYPFGGKDLYGYDALRIYRQELVDIFFDMCAEQDIPIVYGKKFVRVVDETATAVSFEFTDGSIETASMLVGADGIHSRVRSQYIAPGVTTKFTGICAVTFEVAASQLQIPADKDYVFPVQVSSPKGFFVLAPQTPDGGAMLCGTQYFCEEKTREEWAAFMADKEQLKRIVRQSKESFPEIIQSALGEIRANTFNVWPFQQLPPLEKWMSPNRRVVILGDAAHAVPPPTGLGVSQAFEDVYTLGLLIAKERENPKLSWADALDFWQSMRQRRIGSIIELTQQLNNKRLSSTKQAELLAQNPDAVWTDRSAANPRQMAYIYDPQLKKQVNEWIEAQFK